MAKAFKTPAAFKAAVEAHLRKASQAHGIPFSTLQLKFTIERLLARIFATRPPPWLLKGGFAMDLRFRPRARTTKDVDLSVPLAAVNPKAPLASVRDDLQAAADQDSGDYLTYRIGEPKKELTNAPQGGGRFPCECVLLGKVYTRFHVDVGIGDARIGNPEELAGDDLLSVAGIPPATVLAIPRPQQFAEKIHAYTYQWDGRVNTRSKDLVDLVLLIDRGVPEVTEIREALRVTFATRGTHELPETLPPPPPEWEADFRTMARETGISPQTLGDGYSFLERFWSANGLGSRSPT
jgi:nucleotidyltransferase AbiEii toxin of type IV toxin-antitoxin system